MSIKLVMPSNHLILCCPLLLLPLIFPSIRVFSNESVLHIRWPKYWSFSFSISPLKEYSALISFTIDWFLSLLLSKASQESSPTPQCKSIKFLALSFLCSPTLTSVHDYWENHSFDYTDLCWQSDTMSSFVKAFFPRSKHLLISWLQSPSTVILEPKKLKSVIASTFFSFTCHEVMEPDAMIFIF